MSRPAEINAARVKVLIFLATFCFSVIIETTESQEEFHAHFISIESHCR